MDELRRQLARARDLVDAATTRVRRLSWFGALAAVALTVALTGGWALEGGGRTVAAGAVLLVALAPTLTLRWVAGQVDDLVDSLQESVDAVRGWTDADVRGERLDRIRSHVAQLQDGDGRVRRLRNVVVGVRGLHDELDEARALPAARSSLLLASGVVWAWVLAVGVVGTAVVAGAAVAAGVLRAVLSLL